MTSDNTISRWAGALYLVVVATGLFSLAYVPSQLAVANDPHATMERIRASETLFRLGIAGFLVEQVAFLLLPLILYRLLRQVDVRAAVVMVALAVVSVPVALVSVAHRYDALSLLTKPYYATVLAPEQLQAQFALALDGYRNGLRLTSLFWGLWLMPFGWLVYRSGFLPRILGALLMLGSIGYLVDVFATLLLPQYPDSLLADHILTPAAIGEIGTCLWLLLVGARGRKT